MEESKDVTGRPIPNPKELKLHRAKQAALFNLYFHSSCLNEVSD